NADAKHPHTLNNTNGWRQFTADDYNVLANEPRDVRGTTTAKLHARAIASVHDAPRSFARLKAVLALDRAPVHVNPSDVDEAAPPVAAAGHQVGEADLVDSAQIRLLHPSADLGGLLPFGVHGRDGRDVEPQPPDGGDRELGLDEILRVAV